MSKSTRYRIQPDKFENCPGLEQPLMSVLLSIQDDIALSQQGVVKLRRLNPVDVYVSSNTPGTDPWPLRLTQVAGAPLGILLIRCENLTTPGSNGVPISAVSITSQRAEGGTLFVDFISGLTVGQKYRLVFGVLDGK